MSKLWETEEEIASAPVCDGRYCTEKSVGSTFEFVRVPFWRTIPDRPERDTQFEAVKTVYFCARHEKVAKEVVNLLAPFE